MTFSLSPRLKQILGLVVRDYINTAEPVASESLVHRHGLNLSSATVRKVMAELEEMGLLAQPHTSAGRSPTEDGLRVYVDEILEVGRLSEDMRRLINRTLADEKGETGAVLSLCSKLLSDITHNMGVVVAPILGQLTLKQLHFVRLGPGEVLSILVAESGLMQNRVLYVQGDLSQNDLNQVNNYLASLGGRATLREIRALILSDMSREKDEFESLYNRALELSSKALLAEKNQDEGRSIYMEGQTNLFEYPEFTDSYTLKALFKAFEDKRRLVELLDEVAQDGKLRIVIGPEAQKAALDGLALVASPYKDGDRNLGALGIIGPQRLDYAKIVPMVNYAAKVVGKLIQAK